ncbi:hypothetical protein H4Q26_002768 [Puccinia striiformis f. sp. tritici PST-130]|nr:hypothetical protein H4Q26_002768 [Puccinia striiformis f. sp. tritici PST-130]
MPSRSHSNVPLDPDLFNPEIVGETNSFLPAPDEGFYPSEELNWDDVDQNDLDYETEQEPSGEEDEDEDEDFIPKGRVRNKRIGNVNNKRNIRDLAASSGDDLEDGDDSLGEDDDSDHEPDPGDLRRLIGAIHGLDEDQAGENTSHGVLGKKWDKSMDQELNELKEAEEAMRPGKRRRFKARGEPELSVEVSILLGKANLAFIEKKYDEAIPVFEEIVRIEPMCRMAWNNLGAIYKTWELASESRQHGLLSQAIYCYSEAIKGSKNDVESMWDRSYLLFEVGRSRQALAGYLAILKISPHNPDVLHALKHYQSVVISPSSEWLTDGFGLEHIQILVELLIKSQSVSTRTATNNRSIILLLKIKSRFNSIITILLSLSNRPPVGFRVDQILISRFLDWDSLEDDREYDPVRQNREAWEYLSDPRFEESPTYPLDNSLRTYLGICRLYIGDEDEAALHFDLIKSLGVEENAEFCMSIGDAYSEYSQWDEALDFYHDLAENDSTNNAILWHKIGRCYRHLGNLEGALECFEAVAETDALDLTAKTQLAELYEQLGFRQKALDMVNDLIELRRKARESGISIENDLNSTGGNQSRANVLASRTAAGRSMADRRIDEELLTQKYAKTYDKLETISSKLANDDTSSDDVSLMTEYIHLAFPLVEGFRQTSALFPCVLSTKFGGLNTNTSRPGKRDENTAKSSNNPEETVPPETPKEFRGIGFPNWVRIFVYYSFSCAKMDRVDEACEVLGHVMGAPTFRQSAPMQQVLRLAYAASCLAKGDYIETVDTIRWLSIRLLYHNDLVRLINALLCRGFEQSVAFFNTNTQKWLLRQIQIIDGYLGEPHSRVDLRITNDNDGDEDMEDQGTEITAKAPGRRRKRVEHDNPKEVMMNNQMMRDEEGEEENDTYWKPSKFKPTKLSPVFLVTFAQILAGTRSFKSAIVYYLRIRESYPDEPLINLLLAITYVQRAMQRQTDNRHHQIVQGLAFFDHYRTVRQKEFSQEVEFNLGRIYHGLGEANDTGGHTLQPRPCSRSTDRWITTPEDSPASSEPPDDLSNLAAYNLVLIYSTSGSPDLAHRLICQYLTV